MKPPNYDKPNVTTLDAAKYRGYKAAENKRERHRNEYVEINHKQAWLEGYDLFVRNKE